MGLFKKKVVKEIDGGVWGHLVNVHNIDVDTISKELRCVEREGVLDVECDASNISSHFQASGSPSEGYFG